MFDDLLRWLWQEAYTAHCLDVAADPLRAGVWVASNLVVGLSYFGIPNEIRHWSHAFNLDTGAMVARLFRAFIVYCGVSHIAMVLIMPTTRWEMILFFFLPLAGVSLATYVILRMMRQRILAAIGQMRELLQ